ncbi:DUF7534 family protein [Halobiforma nitratireducens]
MDYTKFGKFLLTLLVANALAIIIAGMISPPDPFTLIYYYLPLVPIVIAISYLLVYRIGFSFVTARI